MNMTLRTATAGAGPRQRAAAADERRAFSRGLEQGVEHLPDPRYFRAELIPGLSYVPFAAAFLVMLVGVVPERVETWALLFACGAFALLVRVARRFGESVTSVCLVLGSYACAALALYAYPTAGAASALALVVGLTSILLGPGWGIAAAAAITATLYGAPSLGVQLAPDVATAGSMLGWALAALFWLGNRPLYAVLDWAWYSYMESVEKTEQIRDRQGELGRLSKSLGETIGRLEDLNRELERARLDAVNARRLKDEFATAVSHELRTPLNVIIAFSEMMVLSPQQSYGAPLPPAYRDDVEAMYRNAYHLSNLIDDILDLSQIDAHQIPLQREPSELAEVIESAAVSVASLFRDKRLYLRREIVDELPPLNVDPTRVRQILINLLANAARFTDHGGVTIRVERLDKDVTITTADTGVGMTADEAAHVFEPFRQFGDSSGQRLGHGLGLAISKRLVELHGGSMWVESCPGRGTSFFFTLPLQETVVAGVDVGRPRQWLADQVAHTPRTVVVIEERGDLARLMRRHLDGYRVLRAGSASQAERLAAREPVHALVASADRADQLLTQASSRGRLQGLPVVTCALRVSTPPEEALGIAAYLHKPITRHHLLLALQKLGRPIDDLLVVDDAPDMARMVGRIVQSWRRCTIRTAPEGATALAMLRERRADVVVLDLLMPELDGYATLEAIRADPELRDTPVIVISGRGKEDETRTVSFVAVRRPASMTVGEAVRCVRADLDALLAPGRPHSAPAPPPVLVG